jgi:tRNA(Met) cytidine acetyltransferase
MRGVRIVRIATNPSLFGRGFGSLALKRLEEEMRHKVDWLGASFGASKELVGFWSKNGYVPVHISPMRNAASGEYSVIMIKPLTRKAKSYIREISREFRQRLFDSLHDTYYSLPIDVALQLFKGFEMPKLSRAKLSEAQKGRLDNYIKGEVSYEACSDVIRELLRAHLFTDVNRRLGIPERVEKGLAAKCLQGRSWKYVMDISNLKDPHEIFRRYVERMRRYYLGG